MSNNRIFHPVVGGLYRVKYAADMEMLYKTRFDDKKTNIDRDKCVKMLFNDYFTIVDMDPLKNLIIGGEQKDVVILKVLFENSLWFLEVYDEDIDELFRKCCEKIG